MSTNSTRVDPSAVANASANPAANAMPTPGQEVKWVKQLPYRMKAYGRWLKNFLHGNR